MPWVLRIEYISSKVCVGLIKTGSQLTIAVQDDGMGFDFLKAFGTIRKQGGFGLFSIQERMADLGGGFRVQSEPGKGCLVELIVSLDV